MTVDVTETRGCRNRNPGNIRKSPHGKVWQGEVWPGQDDAFCTFIDAQHGIRAILLTLRSYVTTDGCRSVGAVIRRWAPPCENATQSYTRFVVRRLPAGMNAGSTVNPHDALTMRAMAEAIIAEECADLVYPSEVMDEALRMAGVGV